MCIRRFAQEKRRPQLITKLSTDPAFLKYPDSLNVRENVGLRAVGCHLFNIFGY